MALNIVIMAGGSGTRLWPMSRTNMPKQLQPLIGDKSLLQQTYDRILPLVGPNNIYVGTVSKYLAEMQKQLPQLSADHFILEPSLKNTAPAVGLNAVHLYHKDPKSIMVSLHSDHTVTKPENFQKAIRAAEKIIENHPDHLACVGIKPTYPSTEFGYIQMDDKLEMVDGEDVFIVKKFVEKPDKETAEKFIVDGHYLWNAGYFIWRVDRLLELFKEFVPGIYEHLMAIEKAIGTTDYEKVLNEHYSQMDEIAIDYAIMERAENIDVVPADMGWSDIGTWSSLHDIISGDTGENLISKGDHIHHGTEDSLVYSVGGKLVATVGLKNVIVVDTPDVLLVADKSKSHEVKKIVEQLKADQSKHKYL